MTLTRKRFTELTDTGSCGDWVRAPFKSPTNDQYQGVGERKRRLRVYSALAELRWPKSFGGKIFLVAFVGTHIPLLTLLAYTLISTDGPRHEKTVFLIVALLATLVGTGATLYMIGCLMAPISLTYGALRGYLEREELPILPTEYTDEAGMLMADTTQLIGQLDQAIHRLTNFDPLTTLPNRNLFQDTLRGEVARAREGNRRFALAVIDLKGLKELHLGLGAEVSDAALRTVARRLLDFGPTTEGLARVGDHSFALTFASSIGVRATLTAFLEVLCAPIEDRSVGAAIGVALWPDDAEEPDRLLACAESAVLSARQKGAYEMAFYNTQENEVLRRRLRLEASLHGAMERDELRLAYQPIVDVRLGQIVAVEALLRWNLDGVPVSPAEFIPISEQTGLIVPIGAWVLRTACAQASEWQNTERGPIKISVNVSARQLEDPAFVAHVADALADTGLEPGLLQLEMTESTLMENVEAASATLGRIRELGVIIAVDDFGTGYSSLSSLKRLPIDVLKVDQSFVRSLPEDEDDTAIVRSVSALASSLRMEAVAEGVETPEQARCLMEQGYLRMQGYFFGRPEDAGTLSDRLLQEAAVIEISPE
jgi:diguanylate cyclase (GGDEF)-like protein